MDDVFVDMELVEVVFNQFIIAAFSSSSDLIVFSGSNEESERLSAKIEEYKTNFSGKISSDKYFCMGTWAEMSLKFNNLIYSLVTFKIKLKIQHEGQIVKIFTLVFL